jgi:hypothetical protein
MPSNHGHDTIPGFTTPRDGRGRVLLFRLRAVPPRGGWRRPSPELDGATAVDDLAQYERGDPNDDYRRRMTMNFLALAVTMMLMVCGMWLTGKLVDMDNEQECVLSGRSNCWPIQLPSVQS